MTYKGHEIRMTKFLCNAGLSVADLMHAGAVLMQAPPPKDVKLTLSLRMSGSSELNPVEQSQTYEIINFTLTILSILSPHSQNVQIFPLTRFSWMTPGFCKVHPLTCAGQPVTPIWLAYTEEHCAFPLIQLPLDKIVFFINSCKFSPSKVPLYGIASSLFAEKTLADCSLLPR